MILPIGDDNRDRRIFPIINYTLVFLNILVFIFLQKFGYDNLFTYTYSLVPMEILTGKDIVTGGEAVYNQFGRYLFTLPGLQPTPVSVYITFFTSMFMHGGLAHIFGNMLFLLVFGDNIENKIGHFRYLIFYLLCGILGSIAHVLTSLVADANLLIPTLGASGAISGVLGAYVLLFPRRRVTIMMFYFITNVPAIFALGLWFLFQVINGLGALGGIQEGGIAYGAHIGGFIAGLIIINFFRIGRD
jgi:membrane associated rhomboid family serine protease